MNLGSAAAHCRLPSFTELTRATATKTGLQRTSGRTELGIGFYELVNLRVVDIVTIAESSNSQPVTIGIQLAQWKRCVSDSAA